MIDEMRSKIAQLQQIEADTEALLGAAIDARQRLEDEKREAERMPEEAGEQRERALQLVACRMEAADRLVSERRQKHHAAAQVHAQVRTWLRSVPVGSLAPLPPLPSRKMPKDLVGAIAITRAKISDLRSELQQVATAPLSRDEFEKAIRSYVAELAKNATPSITCDRGNLNVRWRNMSKPNALALAAWLAPDQLTLALENEAPLIDGLSYAERARRIGELQQSILHAEREEEELIVAALAAGLDVSRRPQADPRAVLGLDLAAAIQHAAE